MRALILYAVLVVIGTMVAACIGLFAKRAITERRRRGVPRIVFRQFLRVVDDHQGVGQTHVEDGGAGRDRALGIGTLSLTIILGI
jgi:hypothetical protein